MREETWVPFTYSRSVELSQVIARCDHLLSGSWLVPEVARSDPANSRAVGSEVLLLANSA